jgi:GT2 family glycosyltransferase
MIDVVVVNWNSRELLSRCLSSLARDASGLVDTVIVVDNGSEDRSIQDARLFPGGRFRYRLIENGANAGFAAACNAGARHGSAELILFLNPDCEVFPDTIARTIAQVASLNDPRYAAFGVPLTDASGKVARTCARQPKAADFWVKLLGLDQLTRGRIRSHVMTEWPHAESRDVEHVMGAFYLVRREVFEALRGFDERFFVYLEDLDLSRRILEAGHRIRFLAGAGAYHESGGTSRSIKARRLYYSLKSRVQFGFKHFSGAAAWSLLAGTALVEPLVRLAHAATRANAAEIRHTAAAYGMLWRDMPQLLHQRRVA